MNNNSYRIIKNRFLFYKISANVLSVILHPLLMPTILFGVIILFAPEIFNPLDIDGRRTILIMVFLSTFLMPLLMVLTMTFAYRKDLNMNQLKMHSSRDRFLPFMLIGIFYLLITYYLFSGINPVILLIMFGISAATIIVAIISYFWKISAHSVGISGIIGYLIYITWFFKQYSLFYPLVILIVLAGLVMSARLFLKEHTPAQILAGLLLGIFMSVTTVSLALFFS